MIEQMSSLREQIQDALQKDGGPLGDVPSWHYLGKIPADSALIASDATTIKNIMWNMVGLVRKTPLLERAISDLSQMENTINKFYRDAYLTDELLGLRNLVLVALITAKAAYANPRSIGCHFREA
jgi:L-aspartate oxidase